MEIKQLFKSNTIFWQCLFYASWLVVLLGAALSVFDIFVVDNIADYRFALLPDTTLALLLAAFILFAALGTRSAVYYLALALLAALAAAGLLLHQPITVGTLRLTLLSAEARMPPLQSAAFLLFCFGWLCWRRGKVGRWLFVAAQSVLLVFCITLLLIEHFTTHHISLSISPAAGVNTALYLIMLAVAGLSYWQFAPRWMLIMKSGLSWSLTLLIASSATLLWFNVTHQQQADIIRQANMLHERLQRSVDNLLHEQYGVIHRLAERLAWIQQPLSESYMATESQGYLRDFSYVEYLTVLNQRGGAIFSSARDEETREWFAEYLQQNPVYLTSTADVLEIQYYYDSEMDHAFVYSALPIDSTTEAEAAWLVAGISYIEAMQSVFPQLLPLGYHVRVRPETYDAMLFESAGFHDKLNLLAQRKITFPAGLNWDLDILLDLNTSPRHLTSTAGIILLAGWLATVLAMLSQQLYQLSLRHRTRLLTINDRLRHSLNQAERLRFSQQQIMDHSVDFLCSVDERGYFTQVSRSCLELFGYSEEEMLARPLLDFVHPDDKILTARETELVRSGKQPQGFRNRYIRKDGDVIHLMWSARWSSQYQTMFATARDISPLVRQERYLNAQQNILRMISTEQPLDQILTEVCMLAEHQAPTTRACVMLNTNNTLSVAATPSVSSQFKAALLQIIIADNSSCCGAAAYQKSLVITESLQADDACPPLKEAAMAEGIQACWSLPMVSNNEDVIGTFDLYCTSARSPRKDELELMITCSRFAAVAIERAEQKAELQQNEQRYRSLYEFNPDPVFSFDVKGLFLNMNEAGCKLLGVTEQEITGTNFATLLPPEHLSIVKQYFKQVVAGNAQRYETQVVNRHGQVIDLLVTNLPIRVNRQVVGVFGIAKDISERNKTASALNDALKRAARQSEVLAGLNECALGIHSDWDNSTMLQYIAAQLCKILPCKQALFFVNAGLYNTATLQVSHNELSDTSLIDTEITNEIQSVLNLSLSQATQINSDWLQRHNNDVSALLAQTVTAQYIVASPLKDRLGNVIGSLVIADDNNNRFADDDALIVEQFAKLAFSALEYRQLLRTVIAAEQDLQRQLQFNSAVTNSMTDALLVTDIDGVITFLNPEAKRLLVIDSAATKPDTPLHITDVLPLTSQQWQPFKSYSTELKLAVGPDSSSEQQFFACSTTPLQTGTSQGGWVITLHNVTAQRKASAAMQERDQFFTLSLELFCLLDLTGHFIQVNPAFSQVLKYKPEELIGHTYFKLVDKQDHKKIADAVVALTQGELIQDLEFRAYTKEGELRWMQISAALENDIIFCAARDITANRAAMVQLELTLKELQRSNAELNEFAYVASHDLQEPLRKIRTFGERLNQKAQQLDEQGRDYVERMSLAAERMQNLINDLLLYSRLNAGELQYEQVDMHILVTEVLTDLEFQVRSSSATIELQHLSTIWADARQLRQLVQNLLSNALKFRRPDVALTIVVGMQRQEQQVIFFVEDNGIGFDQQYADKIFNPFQRLHSRSEYAGTGIGLSIVKKIAERHGATISVQTKEGLGSRFNIIFSAQH